MTNTDQTMLMMQTFVLNNLTNTNMSVSQNKSVSSTSDDKQQFRDLLDKRQQKNDKSVDKSTAKSETEKPEPMQTVKEDKEPQVLEEEETETRASEWIAMMQALSGQQQNIQTVQPVQAQTEEITAVTATPAETVEAVSVETVAVEDVATETPVETVLSAQQTDSSILTETVAETPTEEPVVETQNFAQAVAEEARPVVQQQPKAETVQAPVVTEQPVQQQNVRPVEVQVQTQTTNSGEKQALPMEKEDDQTDVSVPAERPVFGEIESVPVKVADPPPVVDTAKPDMAQDLADTVQLNLVNIGDKVEIRLEPKNLGTITIELTNVNGKLGLAIHAETSRTVELLTRHAGELGALVEDRTGREVTIQVQQNQQSEQPNDGRHGQQQEQQPRQQHQPQRQRDEQEDFIQRLRLGLIGLDAQ